MILTVIAFCALFTFLWMSLGWAFHLKSNNLSWVDAFWTFGIWGAAVCLYFSFPGRERGLVMLVLITLWAQRLGGMIIRRVMREEHEDPRYQKIRAGWKQNPLWRSFLVFQFQAGIILLLVLPLMPVFAAPRGPLGLIEKAAIFLWIIAVSGEALADLQLKKFKSDPSNKDRVCQAGLWNYSRHPNYFFESLVWISYFIFALGCPYGWITVISPALILFFLLKVSGIPLAEAQALSKRPQAYREYQKTTSAFIPLPKKRT